MKKNSRSVPKLSRLSAAVTAATIAFGSVGTAEAANWFKLRGTEPGGTAHTLQVWGFLQPTFVNYDTSAISGAVGKASPLNGTLPIPGTVPPRRTDKSSFYLRRARIGIRGTMIPISNDIDYFILTEMGQNGITRPDHNMTVLDASVTFNQLAGKRRDDGSKGLGMRFRMGQFLFSQTSETLSNSTPGRRVHIWMPEATFQNALGRRVYDQGPGNFTGTKVDGARDIGLEVFDWTEFGDPNSPYEFTYSLGVSNGDGIGIQNADRNYRYYGWLSFAKLFDNTRGPRRHDAQVYGFYQTGDIRFNNDLNGDGVPDHKQINPVTGLGGLAACGGVDACRIANAGNAKDINQKYWGIGVQYFNRPFKGYGQVRFNAQYEKAQGLTFDGQQVPSALFSGPLFENFGLRYNPDGVNEGFYIDAGYDINKHLGIKKRTTINLRYDEYDRNKGNAGRAIHTEQLTLTGEYFFHKKARLTLSYGWRKWDANDRTAGKIIGSSGTPASRHNGNAVLSGVGNRFGAQVTFIFKNVLLR
ncbi:MAG TPA: hypothetical protein ENI80_01125 [Acidiferrobacteraceae bacterium]|nr:hypothetical protein [Acidiferrobacteraceae bacterium]